MTSVADEAARPGRVPLYDHARPLIDQTRAESSPRLLVLHTWVQTQRLLIRWGHDVQTVIQALILPSTFLVSINLVFGKPVSAVSGHSALYGSVPMVTLIGAMNGATVGAVGIITERSDGLLARLWVVPVHRASGLLARINAEAVRVVINSFFLLCVGLLLGLRFEQGVDWRSVH